MSILSGLAAQGLSSLAESGLSNLAQAGLAQSGLSAGAQSALSGLGQSAASSLVQPGAIGAGLGIQPYTPLTLTTPAGTASGLASSSQSLGNLDSLASLMQSGSVPGGLTNQLSGQALAANGGNLPGASSTVSSLSSDAGGFAPSSLDPSALESGATMPSLSSTGDLGGLSGQMPSGSTMPALSNPLSGGSLSGSSLASGAGASPPTPDLTSLASSVPNAGSLPGGTAIPGAGAIPGTGSLPTTGSSLPSWPGLSSTGGTGGSLDNAGAVPGLASARNPALPASLGQSVPTAPLPAAGDDTEAAIARILGTKLG